MMASALKKVEIGVLEECIDKFLLESRFFPSKFGGKPAWLDLRNLPSDLACALCLKPCIFLCQVYAPIDENPNCHHRAIFIFMCPDPGCCKINETKNFKVYRCQLPVVNDYYPPDEPHEEESWHPESKVENFSKVCVLCGNPAPFNCGKCKLVSYCSKEHQTSDWKLYGHKFNCGSNIKESCIEVPFLFPELEIAIDHPPEDEHVTKTEEETNSEYLQMIEKFNNGTFDNIPTDELDKYAAKEQDKHFTRYKRRIDRCPEQVIRYEIGGEPLYASKPTFSENDIPSCEQCGSKRQYEFQILSTLLNEISEKDPMNGFDWGTLLIYTCKENCNSGPAYKPEFMYKQEII